MLPDRQSQSVFFSRNIYYICIIHVVFQIKPLKSIRRKVFLLNHGQKLPESRARLQGFFYGMRQFNEFFQWEVSLNGKFTQAFMQIGWMEDDFKNLTAKVWANLDNPIKRYNFSKVSLISCMSPSQVVLLYCDVTTVQLSNGTVHKFHEIFTFHENASSIYFNT